MQVAIDLLELHTKMCNNFAKATMEEPAKGQRATTHGFGPAWLNKFMDELDHAFMCLWVAKELLLCS